MFKLLVLFSAVSFSLFQPANAQGMGVCATKFYSDSSHMVFTGPNIMLDLSRDGTNFIYIHTANLDSVTSFIFETRKKGIPSPNKTVFSYTQENSAEVMRIIHDYLTETGIVVEQNKEGYVGFY